MVAATLAGEAARIIIVDDEPDLREMMAEYLGRQGFRVATAGGGPDLDARLAEAPADLVLLDITMPGEDGLSIARRLHGANAPAIIMVTASDTVIDRVVGLELGADDYIAKPFDLTELRARVRAVLRRRQAQAASAQSMSQDGVEEKRRVPFGRVFLEFDRRALVTAAGAIEPLTAMEFDLLATFARHPNQVMSRDRLLDLAHHRDLEPFDRSIDIRVARLRRKVELDPAKPEVIKTIRGVGYMYVPPRRR